MNCGNLNSVRCETGSYRNTKRKKSPNHVVVYKYRLFNCFEEMAVLAVCLCRVNEVRHKVNGGYVRVVLRMGMVMLVELSQQELKHVL